MNDHVHPIPIDFSFYTVVNSDIHFKCAGEPNRILSDPEIGPFIEQFRSLNSLINHISSYFCCCFFWHLLC